MTLSLEWISDYTHYNVRDEITYPFPNFHGANHNSQGCLLGIYLLSIMIFDYVQQLHGVL